MEIAETRILEGVWQLRIKGDVHGELTVRCAENIVAFDYEDQGDEHLLRVPLPPLSEGLTVLTLDVAGGAPLASIALRAGAAAHEDLEGEVALLRAEFDLVKRFLRQILLNPF